MITPNKVHISPGNGKMGSILSVSLPAVTTCNSNAPCFKACYAARYCKRYPAAREAYEANYDVYKTNPDGYFNDVREVAQIQRYFRWHVSGDIPDKAYFIQLLLVCHLTPATTHLVFTKRADIVNDVLRYQYKPANLVLILSNWYNWKQPNPHNLPVCEVVENADIPDNWKICGGNCTECACRGVGCWELKDGETIAIYKH